ncbi:S9 family peptidase [Myroides sp. LJL116]
MRKVKILFIAILLLINITPISAQNSNKPAHLQAMKISPNHLSPDGKWLIYNKYNDKGKRFSNCFLMNTKTKQQFSFKNNSTFYNHLLKDDFLLEQNKDILSIINLSDTTKTQRIPNIVQFDSDKNNNIIITLNKNGGLSIIKLNKTKHQQLFHIANADTYYVNPNKSIIVYQEKASKKLYAIFLQDFETSLLLSPEQEISNLKWNEKQNCILFKTKNNLVFIDINKKEYRQINLPNQHLENLETEIYNNNDLFISFTISTNDIVPESDFIRIWSSNSGNIIPTRMKNIPKNKNYVIVYKYETKQQIKLDANSGREYKRNTIPNYVVYSKPYENNLFEHPFPQTINYIQNINSKEIKILSAISGEQLYISPDNTHILYPKENSNHWEIYTPSTEKRTLIEKDSIGLQRPLWSSDSKYVVFNKGNNIVKLDVATAKVTKLSNFKESADFNFVGQIFHEINHQGLIDLTKPFVYTVTINHNTAIYKVKDDKSVNILKFTPNKISQIFTNIIDQPTNTIVWLEENYNLPHTINASQNNTNSTLVNTPLPEEAYNWQRQKSIKFKDSHGVELEGFLYYPKNYDANKKFPMITFIYDKVWESNQLKPNQYIPSTYYNQGAYNRTLLNENDYFVFTPDTYVSDSGPGVTAIDCVENGIYAVLAEESSIDEKKIGLAGGSFGGYKSTLIASHSNLFAAILSFAGPTDLIGDFYYRYSDKFRQVPEYGRAEGGQYKMKQTFAENPKKYFDNSPLIHAHKIKTPILLLHGLEDTNVVPEMTSKFFWALKKYKQTAFLALFYHDVGHAFFTESEVSKDATKRYIEWFDYYLKDRKEINWIHNRVDPSKNFM